MEAVLDLASKCRLRGGLNYLHNEGGILFITERNQDARVPVGVCPKSSCLIATYET